MQESACSKTILVLITVLDVPVLFSVRFSLHAADICGAALALPSPSYKLLEGILEPRTQFIYKAPWRHGDRQCQGLKCSNTFKGLG